MRLTPFVQKLGATPGMDSEHGAPRVSIIIPVHQRVQFLPRAVESALAQTYPNFEIVAVADGTLDATREALAPYGSRVRLLAREWGGPAAARNHGLRHSEGAYALFLDSDDLIAPEKLRCHIDLLEARPDVGVSYSAWRTIDKDGRVLAEAAPRHQGAPLLDLLLRSFVLPTVGIVVLRRAVFEDAGGFDESMMVAHDLDLWLRLANAGVHFAPVDGLLTDYRVHRDSLSNAKATTDDIDHRIAAMAQFLSLPELRPEAAAVRERALSIVHLESAARCFRDGEAELGRIYLQRGIAIDPGIVHSSEWLLEFVAGSAFDARTPAPEALIDDLCSGMPLSARAARTLRRRCRGRYHCVAAFAAHQRSDWAAIPKHASGALRRDLALLLNRGLLAITARALAHRYLHR